MTREEMLKIKEDRGYSLAQIAEYSGVPLGTVQKILNGTTRNPRKATTDAIERVLLGEETQYAGKAITYENNGSKTMELKESVAVYGVPVKKQGEYTIEDYCAFPEERRVELIDGVIYDMNAPLTIHQRIIAKFHMRIASFIEGHKGDCMVLFSPLDVQLDCDNRTMVQPDLVIVCDPSKIKGFGIYGAPDFVLEVLSESTRKKDLFIKSQKYHDAGVKEYWMIDSKKKMAIIYNFMEEYYVPKVIPLKGEMGIALYKEELKINLDEIANEIERFRKFE